jgi:hypothetical protein
MKPSSRFLNSRDRFGSRATESPHRPAVPEKQPQEYPVTVEVGGKRYTGFYTVSSGIVTVEIGASMVPVLAQAPNGPRVYSSLIFFGVQKFCGELHYKTRVNARDNSLTHQ